MNVQQAELVLTILRTKSIGRAAKEHHMTVSAVSQSISNLESQLGYRLFERSRSGTVPTEKGKMAVQFCEEIFKSYVGMKALSESFSEQQKSIRIASIPCLIPNLLSPIYEFGKQNSIAINLVEKNNIEVLDDLNGNKADFGFVAFSRDDVKNHPGYNFVELDRADLVVVANKESALAQREEASSGDLAREDWILYSDPMIARHIEAVITEGIEPRVIMSTNNVEFISESINLNYAVTLAPKYKFILKKIEKNDNFRIIPYRSSDTGRGSLWLAYNRDRIFSRIEAEVVEEIRRIIR